VNDHITDPKRIHATLEAHVLPEVEQPGQYVGGEFNIIRKPPERAEVRLALCFPDTYGVGMSCLAYQILYSVVNGLPWAAAERAYAPLPDMQQKMRAHRVPLYTLESFRPVRAFDAVGFSLQSELLYTNVLMMLELAGIPLEAARRREGDPIVIAGGPGASAPEPMAEFIDLFFIGDGEQTTVQFMELLRDIKRQGGKREQVIFEAARTIPGVYAPALYRVRYGEDGLLREITPERPELPRTVTAAKVEDLDASPFPVAPLVPLVETVHERIALEITRGCTRGCRFCHAGFTGRPLRHRSPERLFELACESYARTGYDEIALLSLSASDYPHLGQLLGRLAEHFAPRRVSISLPSLRVSAELKELVEPLSRVRKSGLTIAPEAATARLRAVINKDVSTHELLEGAQAAVARGWRLMKLYFMIGLPTETPQDVAAIPELCGEILRAAAGARSPLRLNVTVSPFVPKPHTPFQWEAAAPLEALWEKMSLIRSARMGRRVQWKFHDPRRSLVEATLARGDRRLGALLRSARRRGAQFDAWDEHFRFELWLDAMQECGIRLDETHPNSPLRPRAADEFLPWDHIDCGVAREFLRAERERALRAQSTPDCREGPCQGCGACNRAGARVERGD